VSEAVEKVLCDGVMEVGDGMMMVMWGELPGALTDDSSRKEHRPCWNCTSGENSRDFGIGGGRQAI
jgi:hypothetical protein